jgi:hypothetical protein
MTYSYSQIFQIALIYIVDGGIYEVNLSDIVGHFYYVKNIFGFPVIRQSVDDEGYSILETSLAY